MPQDKPYYIDAPMERNMEDSRGNYNPTKSLPDISQGLNSVRSYSFECKFTLPGTVAEFTTGNNNVGAGGDNFLTLAAKQVSNISISTEPIEVHRVNDRVFYPGKPSQEEVTITFDNLYQKKVSNTLWNWWQTIYNPMTGLLIPNSFNRNGAAPSFKAKQLEIFHLDPKGSPLYATRLLGVYPTSWRTAEFNYSTNDFHTIEMAFRWDFIDHGDADPT